MTEAQKRLHWNGRHGVPGWYMVRSRNFWHMVKGRLADDAVRGNPANPYHARVWQAAFSLAAARHAAVTEDDLRRGCYIVALGQAKSSKAFTNDDLDRVLTLFRVLANPEESDDLAAVAEQRAYERYDEAKRAGVRDLPDHPGERRRQIWSLKQSPEAVIRAIAQDKFGTADWEDLPLRDLRQLSVTLKNRRAYEHRPAANNNNNNNHGRAALPRRPDSTPSPARFTTPLIPDDEIPF